MTTARRLTPIQMLLYPILHRSKRGTAREILERRQAMTIDQMQANASIRNIKEQLQKEAKLYGAILVEQWTRLGAYYAFRWKIDQTTIQAQKKRKKTEKVRFERIICTPEAIYFKILVGVRTMFGYRNKIPHKVLIKDLISPETIDELSFACGRPVTVKKSSTRGVWIVVHRNETVIAIPKYVTHLQMLEHYPANAGEKASIVLGIGEHRVVHSFDLEHYPHLLVAGASGGGKSNSLNHFLCSLIRFCTTDQLSIVLIDPKRLELTFYKTAPHLLMPIVYDVDEAIQVLDEMIKEVKTRTTVLEGRARKLSEFNERFPAERMSRVVIVIEELAALMQGKKQTDIVQKKLTQLANLGRAVGVHLILCTQLPVVSVIPSTIKVSMWIRLAGKTQNTVESGVILGAGDAARLPAIPGRMVYGKDAYRHEIQTPYVDEDDIHMAIRIAKGRYFGWVDLDGWKPVINREKLLGAVTGNFDIRGRLHIDVLHKLLKAFGISRRQVQAFIEDVIAAKEFEVHGRRWKVVKEGERYHVEPLTGAPIDWDAEAAEGEPNAPNQTAARPYVAYPLLPAPPKIYLLPPPRTEPTGDDAPAPNYPPPEDGPAGAEMFISNCIVTDWESWTSSDDIYRAYVEWCKGRVAPVAARTLGEHLTKMGYQRQQRGSRRVRGWRGVKLLTQKEEIA